MITFILIFFIAIITVGLLSVLGFFFYLKRRNKSLQTNDKNQFSVAPPYRSLFAPTDEEFHALESREPEEVEAKQKEASRKISFEKSEKAREFEKNWRGEPTRQNTIEFLRLAAESKSAEVFSQTAESVIQLLRHEQIEGLSKKDLADLLDIHLRILPQEEKFSGAVFWVKREIERLR